MYKSCTTYETCELRRLWNFITKVLKIWKKNWNMLFQEKSSPFKLRGLFKNSSYVGWVIHVWKWLISMFNFVKLERRIKLKGFDKFLYSMTAVQLSKMRTGTACCWFRDPAGRISDPEILRIPAAQIRSVRPIWDEILLAIVPVVIRIQGSQYSRFPESWWIGISGQLGVYRYSAPR